MEVPEMSGGDLHSFNDALLNLLECPICTEYMTPPIYQCITGHKLCRNCKPLLTECPTCKEKSLDSRNFVAEELAERLLYPCVNVDAGCELKVNLNSMAKHNAVCRYRFRNCLVNDCDWQGRKTEMLEHLKINHNMGWMIASNPHLYYDNFDLSTDFDEHDAVCAFDELFIFHFKKDVANRRAFVAVQYVGDEMFAPKFRYQVFMYSASGDRWVDFVNVTHKDTLSFDEIMSSKKCFSIDFEVIEDLLDDGQCLKFKINISLAKNNSV